jgi:hypothetical protein
MQSSDFQTQLQLALAACEEWLLSRFLAASEERFSHLVLAMQCSLASLLQPLQFSLQPLGELLVSLKAQCSEGRHRHRQVFRNATKSLAKRKSCNNAAFPEEQRERASPKQKVKSRMTLAKVAMREFFVATEKGKNSTTTPSSRFAPSSERRRKRRGCAVTAWALTSLLS